MDNRTDREIHDWSPTMKQHEHPTKDQPETNPEQDEVARKAYAIYTKEGRPQGHAEQNWLEAEAHMPHAGSDHPDDHERREPPALQRVAVRPHGPAGAARFRQRQSEDHAVMGK